MLQGCFHTGVEKKISHQVMGWTEDRWSCDRLFGNHAITTCILTRHPGVGIGLHLAIQDMSHRHPAHHLSTLSWIEETKEGTPHAA